GSTPSQTVNSTVSSNLAKAISLTLATASSRLYLRPTSIFSAAKLYFFPCFFISYLRGACEAFKILNFSLSLKDQEQFHPSSFRLHPSIVRPICRAVPEMVLIAEAKLVVFKS